MLVGGSILAPNDDTGVVFEAEDGSVEAAKGVWCTGSANAHTESAGIPLSASVIEQDAASAPARPTDGGRSLGEVEGCC